VPTRWRGKSRLESTEKGNLPIFAPTAADAERRIRDTKLQNDCAVRKIRQPLIFQANRA
jgi:hypothetical protein